MPINDPKFIKELQEKVNKIDWDDIKKQEKKKEQDKFEGILKVGTKNFFDWLPTILNKYQNNCYSAEESLYMVKTNWSKEDIDNERLICYLMDVLKIIADRQRVKLYSNCLDFEEYEYYYKYKDKFYIYEELYGQGSEIFIRKEKEPDFAYIDLDKFFKEYKDLQEYISKKGR